ncbi:MAG: hypothetical protein Q4E88_04950 [Coriobacteriia bacterium]|nr:hypothetical protein [Coriobacteriia bacterium]
MRKNTSRGKFSNYGKSIFVTKTKNTEYFANLNRKQPTMRGAIPKTTKANVLQNTRPSFKTASLATNVKRNQKTELNYNIGKKPKTNNVVEGNVVRKPEPKKESFKVVPGQLRTPRLFHSAALSPMLLTAAKFAVAAVIVIAVAAFIRVGLSSATVSTGLNSQYLTSQIEQELSKKGALEVQDSTLGNTSKIRSEAAKLNLVAPAVIEQINLGEDVLAYDKNGNISLVESLNRVAHNGR